MSRDKVDAVCVFVFIHYQILISSEKSHRLNVLETEVQKSHIEVATLKAKNATLDKEIMEKEKQYNQLHSRFSQLEKVMLVRHGQMPLLPD